MARIDDVLTWKLNGLEANVIDLGKGYLYSVGEDYNSLDWNCDAPKPTQDQIAVYTAEYEEHVRKTGYIFQRQLEYLKQGLGDHELIVALWEYIVEDNRQPALDLQAKRVKVKQDIPKPAN